MAKFSSPRSSPRKTTMLNLRSRRVSRPSLSSAATTAKSPVFTRVKPSANAKPHSHVKYVNKETGTYRFEKVLAANGVPRYSYFKYLLRSTSLVSLRD